MEDSVASLLAEIAPVLVSVLGALISWGLVEFNRFLRSKVKSDKVRDAIDKVNDIVKSSVDLIGQKLVDDLKRASADGKLTIEEARKVKGAAFKLAKRNLTEETTKLMVKAFGDLDALLSGKIETEVRKSKINN